MASSIFPGAADWALTSLAKEAATGARKSDLLLSMVINYSADRLRLRMDAILASSAA